MPTLPASGYAVPVAPTVEPLAAPPSALQEIRVPAGAFGEATGEALSRLGGQFEQAAGRMENIQSFFDTIAADEQVNKFEDEVNKIMYGDPTKPGDVGYLGLQGREALEQRGSVRQRLDSMIEQQRSGVQNLRQQHLFDQQTRRYRNYALGQVGRHYDEQFNKWAANTTKATTELALNRSAVAASNNDFGGWKDSLGAATSALATSMRAQGRSDPEVELAVTTMTKGMAENWARTRIEKDPVEGTKFVEDNREALGDKYDDLLKLGRSRALKLQAGEIVATGTINDRVSNMVRGAGSVGDRVDAFLNLAASHESNWRNILQNVVPPGGGYNPSVGRVTGPSTASGVWQITNTTWREFAPGAGVDTNEYPTAMSAPVPLQRQVARQIVTTSGVQHWTDYNTRLRASAISNGFPTNGKIEGSPTVADVRQQNEKPLAVGDSIAAHTIRRGAAIGTEFNFDRKEGSTAVASYNPTQVLDLVNSLPEDRVKGQDIVLSTGASNDPAQLDQIPAQITALKQKGARSVSVLGVGTAARVKGVNEQLAKLASDNGATFAGPLPAVAGDGIHSTNPQLVVQQAQAGTKGPDVLLKDVPPLDQGEMPDAEVPGLTALLQDRAKKMPADAPRELWWEVVKQARQQYNAAYQAEQQQRRMKMQVQQDTDRQVTDKYINRMYTAGQVPSEAEIATDKQLSPEAKQHTIAFLRSTTKSDPPAGVSKANQLELLRRMGLPDTDDQAITNERQINDAAINKLITFDDRKELINEFRQMSQTRDADRRREITRITTAAKDVIDPTHRIVGADSSGSNAARVAAYANFVESKVRETKDDPKALRRLFDPTPGNKEYLGAPETIREFTKGGSVGKQIDELYGAQAQQTQLGNIADLQGVIAAWKANKFGPYGSEAARQRAMEYAKARGFGTMRSDQPGVPVR